MFSICLVIVVVIISGWKDNNLHSVPISSLENFYNLESELFLYYNLFNFDIYLVSKYKLFMHGWHDIGSLQAKAHSRKTKHSNNRSSKYQTNITLVITPTVTISSVSNYNTVTSYCCCFLFLFRISCLSFLHR